MSAVKTANAKTKIKMKTEIVKKWGPIIKLLEKDDRKFSDKEMELLCSYAEHHTWLLTNMYNSSGELKEDYSENFTMVLAIKVLSKLVTLDNIHITNGPCFNIDDKIFSCQTYQISIDDASQFIKIKGPFDMDAFADLLVAKTVELLKSNGDKHIYIHCLFSNIKMITEGLKDQRFVCLHRFTAV